MHNTITPVAKSPANVEAITSAIDATRDKRTAQWLLETYGPTWLPRVFAVTSPLANVDNAGKKPQRSGWKQVSAVPAALKADTLSRHLLASLPGNIGLHVPPGVVVLDFDTTPEFEQAHALHPSVPTQRTSKGGHLVFRLPEGTTARNGVKLDLGGGLLADHRTEGGYIVVAPSVHATGATYEWLVPLPLEVDALPVLPEDWATQINKGRAGLTQVPQAPKAPKVSQAHKGLRCQGGGESEERDEIETAIRATLPTKEGMREGNTFHLARRLKAIPALVDLFQTKPALVRPYVDDWYYRSCAAVPVKEDVDRNWAQVVRAWHNVEKPWGEALTAALEAAHQSTNPRVAAIADHLGIENPAFTLLVALCLELGQRHSKSNGVFPLACRIAGDCIEVSHETAREWLGALVAADVLDLVRQGKQGTKSGEANEYRVRPPAESTP